MFKKTEDAFYRVNVLIPITPLEIERTFYVKSFSDVERIQNGAEKFGYKVRGWSVDHRLESGEVIAEIIEAMNNEL